MGKILTCEIHEDVVEGGSHHGLFAAEAEPDQVDRTANSHKEADQQEVGRVEEVVCEPACATPEKKARK